MASAPISTLLHGVGIRDQDIVPRPARRWKSRVLLPSAILITTIAILGYSARSAFLPVTEVWVAPVVAAQHATAPAQNELPSRTQGSDKVACGALLVQAPGWIEPAPYAISVPALAEGVVREVLVLEGDRVVQGQKVAQLVDEDARLHLKTTQAGLAALKAEASKSSADLRAAESRVAEVDDLLVRARQLAPSGAVPQEKVSQLALRLQTAQAEVDALRATVEVGVAGVRKQEVECEIAELALQRTQIVAPVDGVVMSRLVEPGSRISMNGRADRETMSGTVLRLYDPTQLQVRVDVPLADFAKLQVGTPAEVVTEALPDVVLKGVVTRIIHEANIQRNSVPVKVALQNPSEVLKPEMLARVRFYGLQSETLPTSSGAGGDLDSGASLRLLIPGAALVEQKGEQARAWVVGHDHGTSGMIVTQQELKVASCNVPSYVEVLSGLRPGDRVVMEPPSNLTNGQRVRILGEKQIRPDGSENRS